jgi:hypothetical protein
MPYALRGVGGAPALVDVNALFKGKRIYIERRLAVVTRQSFTSGSPDNDRPSSFITKAKPFLSRVEINDFVALDKKRLSLVDVALRFLERRLFPTKGSTERLRRKFTTVFPKKPRCLPVRAVGSALLRSGGKRFFSLAKKTLYAFPPRAKKSLLTCRRFFCSFVRPPLPSPPSVEGKRVLGSEVWSGAIQYAYASL